MKRNRLVKEKRYYDPIKNVSVAFDANFNLTVTNKRFYASRKNVY
jgi:hypothetical protein